MVRTALQSGRQADLILLLTEAHRPQTEKDRGILGNLQDVHIPIFLIINKIDLVVKAHLLPLMEEYQNLHPFEEIIPLSALRGDGIDRLLGKVWEYLPTGPRYFPEDTATDQSERVLAAEMIREKVFQNIYQEIPYAVGVTVESFAEDPEKRLLSISAVIIVEKRSQKAILIGRGGRMLKKIGRQARQDMELFFQTHVFLQLWVKVLRNWSDNPRVLREMGLE
jgi:GTP-binding protein Era